MIPEKAITEWSKIHTWPAQNQIEQDLLICRALVDLFSDPYLAKSLAFRGGTALYKLFFSPSPRYSEDIDLVQVNAEPIGETLDHVRAILDPLLGTPKRKLGRGLATITYRYKSETDLPMNLKLEINTREHFAVMGFTKKKFSLNSSWHSGEVDILTYHLEELMGTKLRALYQRTKGRDLFDMWFALKNHPLEVSKLLEVFHHYMDKQGLSISRAQFEQNMHGKIASDHFLEDTPSLLREKVLNEWNPNEAHALVHEQVISQLPGDPWKGE